MPYPAHAQEEDSLDDEFAMLEEELADDEVESASKHRQSIFWSPSTITVLTREEIRTSGATTLADLLRRIPGFDVYEMKPSFPLVGARALTEHSNNLVLVLVDGREAVIELTGWPIWAATTIDIEEIERVEVIRGPGSTLYGANAFAAVVNITTVAERPATKGEALISYGEVGYRNLYGRVRNAWTLGDGTLSFSTSVGNGERTSPSDRNVATLPIRIRSHGYVRYRHGRDLDLSLHGGVGCLDASFLLIFGDFISRDILNHYVFGKADIGLGSNLRLKAQIYHIRFRGDFHYRSTIKANGLWLANIPDLMIDTNTMDVQVQVDWQAAEWLHLISGMNARYNNMLSDKILAQEVSELRGAWFIQSQLQPWDIFQLTTGFRLDLNNRTDPAISPRVALVLRPADNQAFKLIYCLAFRKPSFVENQLHFQLDEYAFKEIADMVSSFIGNEDLVNEQVHSFEAGWRAHFLDEHIKITVDSFFNVYQNIIYFEQSPSLSDFQYENTNGEVYAFGGEAEINWSPSDNWNFWGNVGFRWVTDDDFDRLRSEPVLRSNLGGHWASDRGPFIDLALHYVSSYDMPLALPENPFEDPIEMSLGNRWLLIGRLGYRITLDQTSRLEMGFTVRTPIGAPFREYPGLEMDADARSVSGSDWVGEKLVRWVSFYLRGSF